MPHPSDVFVFVARVGDHNSGPTRIYSVNYVAEVEEVLGASFGAESLVAGLDSAAGFDSLAGLDSPAAAGAASVAGLSAELDAALGA